MQAFPDNRILITDHDKIIRSFADYNIYKKHPTKSKKKKKLHTIFNINQLFNFLSFNFFTNFELNDGR